MGVPPYDHIVVVMMENKDYSQIIGDMVDAPYINSLAADGALLTNYTAIAHPSQPNYFALFAGSTFGVTDDDHHTEFDPTLATILQSAGKTFTGYVESNGRSYDHNPWESFPEGFTVEQDFNTFPSGNFANLPSVAFVSPNVHDDMHDGTITQGDDWLQANLDSYAQWARANNSLLIVAWDESSQNSTNQIAAILYGDHVIPGAYAAAYNHYNMLSTILGAFNLTGPNNAATAATIDVFGKIISGSVTGPVVLGTADNPLTITAAGTVIATGSGVDGIDGPSAFASTIKNDGTVASADGFGIALVGGGTVGNGPLSEAAASITGKGAGLFINGGVGTLSNAGLVSASGGAGADIEAGGSVSNASGGLIAGSTFGVFISGGSGTVSNVGSVRGAAYGGVLLAAGGSVTNVAGASVRGGHNGVYVQTAAGAVINAGSILGSRDDGVVFAAGGNVFNAAGGVIAGGADGVFIFGGGGAVTNDGTVSGGSTSGYGMIIGSGGSVTNAGLISGRDGLGLRAGGSVTNAASGAISGLGPSGTAVFAAGSPGTLTNAGRIAGNSLGALFVAGGSITNAASGAIVGRVAGLFVNGGAAFLSNEGSIGATAGAAVDLEAGGSVTNNASASITGSGFGVFVTGGSGSVVNSGSIAGGSNIGAFLASGGYVTNNASGSISGHIAGVFTKGARATLSNSGSITATGGAGADIEGGGSVINNAGASVSGGGFGVFITGGSGTVSNSGSITGTSSGGIVLGAGGGVANNAGASITGGSNGVYVKYGAAGTITNMGLISASSGAGVDLAGGGNVVNAADASILGGQFGVFIANGVGTVTNNGTIVGGTYAVKFSGGGTNRLVVGPTSVIIGAVGGSASATSALEFAGGSGVISGMSGGSGMVTENGQSWSFCGDFGTLAIDPGGVWIMSGTNTAPFMANYGLVEISGSLNVSDAIDQASTGLFQLDNGARLEIAAALGTDVQMRFLASSSLVIDNAGAFGINVGTASYAGPQLQNFGVGDTIDLKSFSAAGVAWNYDASTGVLQVSDSALQVASLAFQTSSLGAGTFHATTDGATGIYITHG
ncbi:alkaline phosphatase family protein [Limobrevibacterium gyesilva]|uniref:Phosphoesterase family protein n=1 Tax=Limobrevibacterium gyesilva TaxID=2991712 RepID=A0AA42CCF5_9PROT|nr:alkaline phosphatase family protein [Limobrevibacterium gyesilva]MCW3473268.1 hypothetical protein [Limobrevibacterium gyesilva]